MAETAGQFRAVRVGGVSGGAEDATIVELPTVADESIFQLRTTANDVMFTLERDREGQLLATRNYNYPFLAYQTTLLAFILGQPAEQIRDTLLSYGDAPYQDCNPNDYTNLCPDLLYLQALSYELSGDEANAIATYRQLWRDYPDHPYTFIIRAKLEPQ